MTVLFASRTFFERHDADLVRISAVEGPRGPIERIEVPEGEVTVLSPADSVRITVAFSSIDLLGRPQLGLPQRFMAAALGAPNLEWLHMRGVGSDDPVYDGLLARGITVSNSVGSTAEPIATTTVAALLSLARGLPFYGANQREHGWRLQRAPNDLSGQTVTIVGYGSIGGYVAKYLRAFGVRIIGVRRTPATAADGVDEWVPPDRLAEVLPRTHWLVLATPLTPETRGLIGAQALALLPAGAHLLNIGRGPVVDEAALIEALRSGHLAGAYLDVFAKEPLPEESPLWDMPNVIITPHDSATSRGNLARVNAIFLEELERWQRGEQPKRRIER